MLIDSSINDFYNQCAEDTRLKTGLGPLEYLRNKQLIERYLPAAPAVIADIGGGTGHYAAWLAGMGHQVVLVDPVGKHIQLAEKRSRKSKRAFKCIEGEARCLPIASNSIDLVILHGPLYHLQEPAQRIAAIKEARRILKTGGTVIGFAITYAASTLAALQNGMLHHPDIYQMCRQELQNGEHEPPPAFPGMLAQAFFHRPDQLSQEFEEAGLIKVGMHAVEGLAWLDAKFFESWASPEKQRQLLELVAATESDPELLCLSPHIMLAAEVDYNS
ncbi:ubiquinone/menaquinone biosynthesis C-methylase UbiE [Mucilaginibacter gracilis]|uniref:Ubiquinone/menaquinone biosynthesis C-methylase UbiE n=1 Tax=Mucilaginibacter gracilis TaxID=423350 RepID=A0A495J201_9SPHI|nr:class I SAM-dependent methyltransferase [Mucilaginibacter gracilis]RKR82119.1 ubiquinone/menaquinone biosynthesis C-methylase UbiE [Mucilaginibacter gracilis]